MKPCPFCAEQIQDAAIKCRFCGRMLSDPESSPGRRLSGEATGAPAPDLQRPATDSAHTKLAPIREMSAGIWVLVVLATVVGSVCLNLLAGDLLGFPYATLGQGGIGGLYWGIYLSGALVVGWLWRLKGYRAYRGYLVALAVTPVPAFIIWLYRKPNRPGQETRLRAGGRKKCPACAEWVWAEAVLCKNCHTDLRNVT